MKTAVMSRPIRNPRLLVLFVLLFIVNIGFGITVPVLPLYAERLALGTGGSSDLIAMHIGALTAVYALAQVIFAPLWGRWADRSGRKPMILLGMSGFLIAQVMFGVATSLPMLYAARVIGGMLSAALVPAAAANVADLLAESERRQGMAWLNSMASLGVIAGPALSGLLSSGDWHLQWRVGHFQIDRFSVPFFVAAGMALLAIIAAILLLSETRPQANRASATSAGVQPGRLGKQLRGLLLLTLVTQLVLAAFESTFVLFARERLGFSVSEVGYGFAVCGLVMAVAQVGLVGAISERVGDRRLLVVGFFSSGIGLTLLLVAQSVPLALVAVAILALGIALVTPVLLSLVSASDRVRSGTVLGLQSAAGGLGQVGGALVGGFLFAWQSGAPVAIAALLMFAASAWSVRRAVANSHSGRYSP